MAGRKGDVEGGIQNALLRISDRKHTVLQGFNYYTHTHGTKISASTLLVPEYLNPLLRISDRKHTLLQHIRYFAHTLIAQNILILLYLALANLTRFAGHIFQFFIVETKYR